MSRFVHFAAEKPSMGLCINVDAIAFIREKEGNNLEPKTIIVMVTGEELPFALSYRDTLLKLGLITE